MIKYDTKRMVKQAEKESKINAWWDGLNPMVKEQIAEQNGYVPDNKAGG